MKHLLPDKFESFVLEGDILKKGKADYLDWTAEEGATFFNDFLEWLGSKDLVYAGAFGALTQFQDG